MSEPKQDALDVIAGAQLRETYYVWDDDGDAIVDWDDGNWNVEMVVRDRKGTQLARIANFGTRDGEVDLLSDGRLRITLPGAFTAGLPTTREYTNSTDPRLVGFRHRGVHFFDLIATETTDDDVSDLVQGTLTVHQPVS